MMKIDVGSAISYKIGVGRVGRVGQRWLCWSMCSWSTDVVGELASYGVGLVYERAIIGCEV